MHNFDVENPKKLWEGDTRGNVPFPHALSVGPGARFLGARKCQSPGNNCLPTRYTLKAQLRDQEHRVAIGPFTFCIRRVLTWQVGLHGVGLPIIF